jgi:HAD superfamily hydrolase (TIGR01662 family)
VLSGLAAGCDTAAHEGCLEVQGRAIGVMGNAIDTIYPEENRPLAEAILSCGGCIVSEYAPGVRMNKYQLVTRDRLQAAMSDSIIVGQTDQAGGSMHAANFAIDDISRPVGVLSVDNCKGAKFSGNTDLLGRGAIPITNADDLLTFISRSRINNEDGAILFDLDQTLIDSSKLEKKRQARQWDWILSNLELVQPREGIENLLSEIEVTGLSIGLVTSAPRHYADTVCQRFGWTFDTVVTYHDTHFHKPHPNPLLKAASNLGLDPENCIYIGDDEKDQIAARRAGMHFFHIFKEGMNGESLKNFLEQLPGRLDK